MADLVSQAPLAFAAGLISVLSPCVLPLMPAYLSLVSGLSVEQMEAGAGAGLRRRVLLSCCGFIAGFSIVFMAMGVGAVAIGRVVRTWQAELFGVAFGISQLAGVVIVLFGLHMTGLVPIGILNRDTRPRLGGNGVGESGAAGRGFGAPNSADPFDHPDLKQPDNVVIFECVGVPGMLDQVFLGAPQNARVVVVGVCLQMDHARPLIAINKELNVQYVLGYHPKEFKETLEYIADGTFDTEPLVTAKISLDEVANAFETLRTPDQHAKIVVQPSLQQ